MQPNEPPQFSIDYLDQISSVPPKRSTGNDKLFFAVIFAGILVALVVGILAFLNTGGGSSSDMTRLSARLQNIQTISDDANKHITSSSLRATNTSLSLLLTNINRDIEEPLSALGVSSSKLDAKIVASEDTTEVTDRLEEARLNAIYDRIYVVEMTYQLETLMALVRKTEAGTKNSANKKFLTDTYQKIEPIQKQFSAFSAANS